MANSIIVASVLACHFYGAVGSFLTAKHAVAGEPEEPPLKFVIEKGTEKIPIELDKPFNITVGSETGTFTLRVAPNRTFQVDRISFDYPSKYAYQHNQKPAIDEWRLRGAHTTLQFFRYKLLQDAAAVQKATASGIVTAFRSDPGKTVSVDSCKLNLGEKVVDGSRIDVSTKALKLRQEVFHFSHAGVVYAIIITEEALGSDGELTQDTKDMMKLLDTTIKFGNP